MSSEEGVGGAGADEQPAAKKQRKFTEADLGGPIEDEETARKKLEDAGFDPDKVTEPAIVKCPRRFGRALVGHWYVNPICHFAAAGDLKMCRYLVARGASTTDEVANEDCIDVELFPMAAAAKCDMKDVCQWLFHHGAHGNISRVVRRVRDDATPLRLALDPWSPPNQDMEAAKWLILNGAIPSDSEGYLNGSVMDKVFKIYSYDMRYDRTSLHDGQFRRELLLQWAEEICSDHDNFLIFLGGTIQALRFDAAKGSEQRPARCLNGHKGIRKKIAEYVGEITGRNLRTVRCIVEPLKKALDEAPSDRASYRLLN